MLTTQNVSAPHDHIGGSHNADVEWLEVLKRPAAPPARPPWRPARWQVPAGENPTNRVPDQEPYDTVPRGSLPLLGELPRSWDSSPMNTENYRAVTLALTTRLVFAFGWLVGDAKWAMGIIRGAHGDEWAEFRRSGGLCPGDATKRLIVAWMTWRQIPVPRWLQPAVERANPPLVPPPQPGTYGNAAVARGALSGTAPAWSRSSSPHSGPGAAIRAQPRPRNKTRATGIPAPSRANPPQSPRQDRAAKRPAQRYLPTPQRHNDTTSAPPQGAPTANHGSPAPPAERGSIPHRTATATNPATDARPHEPLGTTRPQPMTTPSPTRNPTPQAQASACGHHPPTPTRAEPQPHPHRDSPAQPTAPVPPGSPPPRPRPRPRPRHAPPPRTPMPRHARRTTRSEQRCRTHRGRQWPKPWPARAAGKPRQGRLTRQTRARRGQRPTPRITRRRSGAAQGPATRHGPRNGRIHRPHQHPTRGGGAPRRAPEPEPRGRRKVTIAEDQAAHGTPSQWPSRMWKR